MESRAIFTSRSGGRSQAPYNERNLALHVGDDGQVVLQNRLELAVELAVAPTRLFFMEQNHGTDIHVIDGKSNPADSYRCDALITTTPGTALAVLVADCAPLLLMGERTSAAVHVGWRGLFGGIVEKVLEKMAGEQFSAIIGPTICGNCYQVGDDLRKAAAQRGFITGSDTLDIPRSILKILSERCETSLTSARWNDRCTFESGAHFSFRRDGVTGRQAGVVIHGT